MTENFIRKIQKYPRRTLISRKRVALENVEEFTSKKIKPTAVKDISNTTTPPPFGEAINPPATGNMGGDDIVVNISTTNKIPDGLKFTALEWLEFHMCRSIVESHLSGFSNIKSYTLTKHKLIFYSFEDTNIVGIELENDRISLTETSLNTIYYLIDLLNHNVLFLESVNLANYYNTIVTEALISPDIIFDSIVNTNVTNTPPH
ncbi:hypothetical protein CBL_20252 [Carabus blaptoides fortunei]